MKLVSFINQNNQERAGLLLNGAVFDLSDAARAVGALTFRDVPSRSRVERNLFHFTRPCSFVTTSPSSSHVTLILVASAPFPSHEPETPGGEVPIVKRVGPV